jgi:CRISPR-associated protein Csm3
MVEFKFEGKFIITAELVAETGLHIGGATESIEIGGVDNIVLKDPLTGLPYIPGSSLKGKMRSLLEWVVECKNGLSCVQRQLQDKKDKRKEELIKNEERSEKEAEEIAEKEIYSITACDCGECDVCIIFGTSAAETKSNAPTRLIVRDAMPTGYKDFVKEKPEYKETIKKWKDELGENIFTEVKWENVIDRITSAATPRQFERIPAGSAFIVEMIYDIYHKDDYKKLEKVFQGMKLLEDSYLGGSGTRGYGKVQFRNITVKWRPVTDYQKIEELNEDKHKLVENESTTEIWTKLKENPDFQKLIGG